MFNLEREDHRLFHDLCRTLLLFEPAKRKELRAKRESCRPRLYFSSHVKQRAVGRCVDPASCILGSNGTGDVRFGAGVRAADALDHAFFKLEPEKEYSDATLLQYPDVPIPPPTMPQVKVCLNAIAERLVRTRLLRSISTTRSGNGVLHFSKRLPALEVPFWAARSSRSELACSVYSFPPGAETARDAWS